jgi:hypothetical protein
MKLQATNSKLQRSSKLPSTNLPSAVLPFEVDYWVFSGARLLVLGVSPASGDSLELGAWNLELRFS